MPKYVSTKTYEHSIGLSCCFRQWRAKSHCHFLHGYALKVRVEFEAKELDDNSWVIDFGSLGLFKDWLQRTFDHKLLIAQDDPHRLNLLDLSEMGLAQVVVVPATGCEAFAKMVHEEVVKWLKDNGHNGRVKVRSVEVAEHGANSALYLP